MVTLLLKCFHDRSNLSGAGVTGCCCWESLIHGRETEASMALHWGRARFGATVATYFSRAPPKSQQGRKRWPGPLQDGKPSQHASPSTNCPSSWSPWLQPHCCLNWTITAFPQSVCWGVESVHPASFPLTTAAPSSFLWGTAPSSFDVAEVGLPQTLGFNCSGVWLGHWDSKECSR